MITRPANLLLLASLAGCGGSGPAGSHTYHSATGEFRFAIPDAWSGRYRVDTVPGQAPLARHSAMEQVVTFSYLPQDTTIRPQVLLALVTLPRVEWDRMSREPGPPQGDLLAERGDRVVVAALPQSNPFDSLSPDGRQFDAIRLTPDQLRRAITLD